MIPYKVVLFTYDVTHRKTQDLLIELYLAGVECVAVLAAPLVKIKTSATWKGYQPLSFSSPTSTFEICQKFKIPYIVIPHNDVEIIKNTINKYEANIAIIGGARILTKPIIDMFEFGVINYHPGKIPETSGLDSFYWMLEKDIPPVITTHFIDDKVDAGDAVLFKNVNIEEEDTLATVNYKLYISQIESHIQICNFLNKGEIINKTPLNRLLKNTPMSNFQRKAAVSKFNNWKKKILNSDE